MLKKENDNSFIKISLDFFYEFKNELSLIIFLVSCYILLHNPINLLISNFLVKNILKYIYAEKWYNDLIYYGLILILIYRVYKHWQKQYYLNRTYSILFSITIIYAINRTLQTWTFNSTYLISDIYYSDILIICSLLIIILLTKTYYSKYFTNKPIQNKELGFITDKPIQDIEEDKLQYSNYAESIAKKILNTEAEKSFAIGINGKWGTGKTSFFNLIKKKIDAENSEAILIDFSPWNTESPTSILLDFFETFEEKLSYQNSNISRQVNKYSEKLLALNEIDNTKPFYIFLSSLFGKNKTLTNIKKELEKDIEQINKKIIVFIDDLDRLDNFEINEVLKLIRNTANFKNTFFIVAYDRNYIINALTHLNTYNKEGFLEKIFQLEINLPYYEKSELCQKLFENLAHFFPDKKELLEWNILRKTDDGDINLIYENINSMRDIILLSNSLILNYENLKGNVDFNNLLYLEILRIKYSNIYEILKNKNNEFISLDKYTKGLYNLKQVNEETTLFKILDENNIIINIDLLSINKIKQLLIELFNTKKANFLSLCNTSKYENYFSYRLLEKTLDENEFKNFIEKDIETLKRQITIWINKGFEFDLLKRFYSIVKYKDKQDYQKNLKLIFYIANHKGNKSENIIGFDNDVMYYRFCFYKSFKKINYNFNEHKAFIIKSLTDSEYPFSFETKLIHELYNKNRHEKPEYRFPFNKDELLEIASGFLDRYIEYNDVLNTDLIPIIRSNAHKTLDYKNTGVKYSFSEITKQKIINYLNSQKLENIIRIAINQKYSYSSELLFNITSEIFSVFESKKSLIIYFENRKDEIDSKLYEDFYNFLQKIDNDNNQIQFKFEEIDW